MLDKSGEGTSYIYRKQFESGFVPNGFSVAYARRDERESRESRPGDETNSMYVLLGWCVSKSAKSLYFAWV